ncbi:MAG: hypothetical protein H0U92_08780 [Actinobacteria bacterium]|nr:hypothetical protein [Actinomycetota bacterium]
MLVRQRDLLVDHGVRTFVDLTRPTEGLDPYDDVGRTATVAGCCLVHTGLNADAALARIDSLRAVTRNGGRSAPQTADQRQVIHEYGSGGLLDEASQAPPDCHNPSPSHPA